MNLFIPLSSLHPQCFVGHRGGSSRRERRSHKYIATEGDIPHHRPRIERGLHQRLPEVQHCTNAIVIVRLDLLTISTSQPSLLVGAAESQATSM
jgi:hypothetical protein